MTPTIPTRRSADLGKATMSDLQARVEQAKQDVQGLSERPDNDTLLRLYALYKQGSEGVVSGPKPGFFDFVATAKYEAWAKLVGTGQDDAKQKYVDLVKQLAGRPAHPRWPATPANASPTERSQLGRASGRERECHHV